ncbi:MAG: MFS transporter [Verrucomicrobiae bacterium]|nr:MFS transporter [Verrucomicrobiae bacterium]
MNDSPKALTALEVSQGMRRSIVGSGVCAVFMVCVSPQFLNGFLLRLHASEFEVALLTTLPMLGLGLQFGMMLFLHRLKERRPTWFWLASIHRLLWLVLAALPLLAGGLGAPASVVLFLGVFFLSSALGSASSPMWLSWMADLVPKDRAGAFWARRTALVSLLQVLAIPAGWGVDRFTGGGALWPYALLFFIGAFFGQADVAIHNRIVEPPVPPSQGGTLSALRQVFTNSDSRRLLVYLCSVNSVIFLASSFLVLYFLERGVSQSFLALAMSVMWVLRWITARYWGFLGDRFGHAATLRLCGVGLALWPFSVVGFGETHPRATLLGIYVWMGLFSAGYESALMALLLRVTPSRSRSLALSLMQGMGGLCAAVGPLIGGGLLVAMKSWEADLPFGRYEVLFFLEGMLRLVTLGTLPLRFREAASATPAMLIRRLMDANPFKVLHHSYVLEEGLRESVRVDAVRGIEESPSSIASEPLLRALRDPSLNVRRGAVRALVAVRDPVCGARLIEAASSSELQIQTEAIEALGELGDRTATPFLLAALEDPSLRLPALRGLAVLKDPAALAKVRSLALSPEENEIVRATALEAWCASEDDAAVAPGLAFLRACRAEIPRWQAAIALARMTVAPEDYYSALQQELKVPGSAVADPPMSASRRVSGFGREKRSSRIAEQLFREAQQAYVARRWREAVLGFVLAALVTLDVAQVPRTERGFSWREAMAKPTGEALARTLAALAPTRSRLLNGFRLAEALLDAARSETTVLTREEALLAWCLARKFARA